MISIENIIANITARAMEPGTLSHPLQSTYDRKQARRDRPLVRTRSWLRLFAARNAAASQ